MNRLTLKTRWNASRAVVDAVIPCKRPWVVGVNGSNVKGMNVVNHVAGASGGISDTSVSSGVTGVSSSSVPVPLTAWGT